MNNIVRTAIEALAGVLGGTQSLHTNSYDEAWALPTEQAVKVALRTQQIIAEETGVAQSVDPLGGSYYLEHLTNELEEKAYRYFEKIDEIGGVISAIEKGYLQKEIAETAYRSQLDIEKEKEVIVGVNKYAEIEEDKIEILKVDNEAQKIQINRLNELKRNRDSKKVNEALENLRKTYENNDKNCMYDTIKAVQAYATLQEIVDVGRQVFGEWKEPQIF